MYCPPKSQNLNLRRIIRTEKKNIYIYYICGISHLKNTHRLCQFNLFLDTILPLKIIHFIFMFRRFFFIFRFYHTHTLIKYFDKPFLSRTAKSRMAQKCLNKKTESETKKLAYFKCKFFIIKFFQQNLGNFTF